ncbi:MULTISPECIES: hypothetical protein [unclassified Frankia]|uniref:hypothetical protein n=1 Tax=unclassified Frankia TaxID=2632575 RepID=UPI002023EA0C
MSAARHTGPALADAPAATAPHAPRATAAAERAGTAGIPGTNRMPGTARTAGAAVGHAVIGGLSHGGRVISAAVLVLVVAVATFLACGMVAVGLFTLVSGPAVIPGVLLDALIGVLAALLIIRFAPVPTLTRPSGGQERPVPRPPETGHDRDGPG